jgi:hypothetical protein
MSKRGEPRDILTKYHKTEMISDYYAGMKYKDLAIKYGVTDSAVSGVMWRAKLPFDRLVVTEEEKNHAAYFCAKRRAQIDEIKIPAAFSFSRRLSAKALDETVFDFSTPEAAYWVGLLMADGCVLLTPTPNIVIQLTTPDEYHVETFKKFLKCGNKVSYLSANTTSRGAKQQPRARISVLSERLGYVVNQYGLVPRKSRTAKAKIVENHPDFWRGMIDGDGHVKTDGGVSLIGSDFIVDQFNEFCKKLYPKAKMNFRRHFNMNVGTLHGKAAAIVLYSIYHNREPCLTRKSISARNHYSKFYSMEQ